MPNSKNKTQASKKGGTPAPAGKSTPNITETGVVTPVIEDNVPIPAQTRQSNWSFLKNMSIGQSFMLTGESAREDVRKAYQAGLKSYNLKLVYRQVSQDPIQYRVWLTGVREPA